MSGLAGSRITKGHGSCSLSELVWRLNQLLQPGVLLHWVSRSWTLSSAVHCSFTVVTAIRLVIQCMYHIGILSPLVIASILISHLRFRGDGDRNRPPPFDTEKTRNRTKTVGSLTQQQYHLAHRQSWRLTGREGRNSTTDQLRRPFAQRISYRTHFLPFLC